MFAFYEGVPTALVLLVWLGVFVSLFALNEVTRRFKWMGVSAFVILPVVLTILWLTAFKDTAYIGSIWQRCTPPQRDVSASGVSGM